MIETSFSQPISITELTEYLKSIITESCRNIWIKGEISNCRISANGHVYFSLKDESAVISAVLFRGRRKKVRFTLEDGAEIIAFGSIDVYRMLFFTLADLCYLHCEKRLS